MSESSSLIWVCSVQVYTCILGAHTGFISAHYVQWSLKRMLLFELECKLRKFTVSFSFYEDVVFLLKKFSLCHKLKFSNVFIFPTRWCKYFKLNYGDLTEFIDCNSSVPEFKEFERRFKFKPRLKYGWFHLKCFKIQAGAKFKPGFWRILADLNRGSNSLNSISGLRHWVTKI